MTRLSHPASSAADIAEQRFVAGPLDIYFVCWHALVLTAARWVTNALVFGPLASASGVPSDCVGKFKDMAWQGACPGSEPPPPKIFLTHPVPVHTRPLRNPGRSWSWALARDAGKPTLVAVLKTAPLGFTMSAWLCVCDVCSWCSVRLLRPPTGRRVLRRGVVLWRVSHEPLGLGRARVTGLVGADGTTGRGVQTAFIPRNSPTKTLERISMVTLQRVPPSPYACF